jgi:hypothetical protein
VHKVFIRLVPIHTRTYLIWVEAYRESAEPRVDAGLIDIDGYAEFAVGIGNALQVEVNFVDCECEVREVDGDEDVAPVRDVAGRAGLRFRVAGANEDAVENCLSPTCCLSCVKTLHRYPTSMVYIARGTYQWDQELPHQERTDSVPGHVCLRHVTRSPNECHEGVEGYC